MFFIFGLRLHAARPRSCGGERLRTGSNSVSEEFAGDRTLSTAYLQIEAVVETKKGDDTDTNQGNEAQQWLLT